MKKAKKAAPERVAFRGDYDRGLLKAFLAVCEQDGCGVNAGVETMMRWAVNNNSLLPVMKAEASLACDLAGIHRDLTAALARVQIAVTHIEDADEGEEWKKGGAA